MRAKLIGIGMTVIAVTCFAWVTPNHPSLFAQRNGGSLPDASEPDGLTALAGPVVDGQQLIVVIDEERRIMGSYHVDIKSGQIALRSVRNFRWDLEMDQFNGTEPSPEKIQALLRSR